MKKEKKNKQNLNSIEGRSANILMVVRRGLLTKGGRLGVFLHIRLDFRSFLALSAIAVLG